MENQIENVNLNSATTNENINLNETTTSPSCSVLVKNLARNSELEKTLGEFFSFCGTIAALSIVDDASDENLVTAVVTFNEANGAKTAVLLTNTQINDRNVTVELVESKPTSVNMIQETPVLPQKGTVDVVLGIGSEIADSAYVAARSIDEKIHVTETFGNVVAGFEDGVKSLDQEYQVSAMGAEIVHNLTDKATEIDTTYRISEQATLLGETFKGSLLQLEHDHQISQKMNEVTEVVATGVGSGVQQISEFLNTNETAKNSIEYMNDVSVSLGSAIGGLWSSWTQPAPVSTPNTSSPQIQISTNNGSTSSSSTSTI